MRAAAADINSGSFLTNSMHSYGLFTKQEIAEAKYRRFSRFGRVMDAHGRLNNTTEYLFFVKPDLHIVEAASGSGSYGGLTLNQELDGNLYFYDLVRLYPDVVRELQRSAPQLRANDPFSHLLSFCVNSSLDLPSIEATTIDTAQTMYGTSIEYLGDAEASDENHSFSLEFVDSKELEVYQFFRAYQEYQVQRKSGGVTPPNRSYYTFGKRLHNVMGIYKFLVDEDMETLIYWAYLWGVFPTSAPREAFSDPSFPDGLTFSVNFKCPFVDDLKPEILMNFNQLMGPLTSGRRHLSTHELKDINGQLMGDPLGSVVGELPSAALIAESGSLRGHNGRSKYKIEWYA